MFVHHTRASRYLHIRYLLTYLLAPPSLSSNVDSLPFFSVLSTSIWGAFSSRQAPARVTPHRHFTAHSRRLYRRVRERAVESPERRVRQSTCTSKRRFCAFSLPELVPTPRRVEPIRVEPHPQTAPSVASPCVTPTPSRRPSKVTTSTSTASLATRAASAF